MTNKEKVIRIKNKLRYPKELIQLLMDKNVNRKDIPIEFFEDAVRVINQIVRLLNKLAK